MGKSAPQAPDYSRIAGQQGQISSQLLDQQTAANRPTVYTPWGSQTWTRSPGGTRTEAGTATNGAQFDAQRYLEANPDVAQNWSGNAYEHFQRHGQGEGRQGFWQDITVNAPDSWEQRITLSPDQQAALDSQMAIQRGRSQGAQTLLDQSIRNFQSPMNWNAMPARAESISAPSLGGSFGNPNVRNLDSAQAGELTSGVQQRGTMTGVSGGSIQSQLNQSPGQWRQAAQDAVWNLQRPMLEEQRAGLENQLANQGLARGSEAWNREMRRMDDSFARAQLQAIETGRGEASQMFGQDLASGQFANAAQAQQFGQGMSNAGLFNAAQQQMFNQDMANAGLANAAQGQRFNQDLQRLGFENQAGQQQFENMNRLAQLGDSRAAQQLDMMLRAGAFNNQNRQQAISEEQMRRGQTLNELNALLTGQQVSMPQMPSFVSAGRAETPNLLGAAGQQYQASLDGFNAQQMGSASMMNGLFGLGSAFIGNPTAMAGLFGMGSLAEYKQNIRQVGWHAKLNIPIMAWEYKPEFAAKWGAGTHVGVMVEHLKTKLPAAIGVDEDGHTVVNYNMVWS